jgi:hypothetical protein
MEVILMVKNVNVEDRMEMGNELTKWIEYENGEFENMTQQAYESITISAQLQ